MTGSLHGLTLRTSTPAHLARAAVEGLLCGPADGLDALTAHGLVVQRVLFIGGAARNQAVREIAPAVFGRPVAVPPSGEYVADGAARQAAWALTGPPPAWSTAEVDVYQTPADPFVRARYAEARDHVLEHM